MVLEATMLCIDNSEYQRNGDFAPSRMYAQQQAANMIAKMKTNANKESSVGVLSMGNKVQVLATLMSDDSKLFMEIHKTQIDGKSNFFAGLRVASLALKHRMNRNQRMRIVMFVGSPIHEEIPKQDMVRLGKRFKKDKINVDIVCFGSEVLGSTTQEPLQTLVDIINQNVESGESHLITVPVGADMASVLRTSPICSSGEAMPDSTVMGGGGGGFDNDPDLEMALRMSLEEHRQREGGGAVVGAPVAAAPAESPTPKQQTDNVPEHGNPDAMTEEEQLAWAMQISLQDSEMPLAEAPKVETADAIATEDSKTKNNDDDVNMDDLTDPTALQELVTNLTKQDNSLSTAIEEPKDESEKKDEAKKE